MLPRTARLEGSKPTGPPPEQDIPLDIPKRTAVYIEQVHLLSRPCFLSRCIWTPGQTVVCSCQTCCANQNQGSLSLPVATAIVVWLLLIFWQRAAEAKGLPCRQGIGLLHLSGPRGGWIAEKQFSLIVILCVIVLQQYNPGLLLL